MHAVTVLLM